MKAAWRVRICQKLGLITLFFLCLACFSKDREVIRLKPPFTDLTALTDTEKAVILALKNNSPTAIVKLRRDYLRLQLDEGMSFDRGSPEERDFLAGKGDYYAFIFDKSKISKKYGRKIGNLESFAAALAKTDELEIVRSKLVPEGNSIAFEYNTCVYAIEIPCPNGECYLRSFNFDANTGRGTCF